MQWQCVVIYLDDFIICSGDDYVEHIQKVDEVLERIEKVGLKLKPAKSEFLQSIVLFLGHIVGKDGMKTNPELISKVVEWPIPPDVKQVQSF